MKRALSALVVLALGSALAGCAIGPASSHPDDDPRPAHTHGLDSPIDRLDAFAMCRALLTSRAPVDRAIALSAESLGAASIEAYDGTFEVEVRGWTSAGDGSAFCVLTGTVGDPRLVYSAIGSVGAGKGSYLAVRDTTLESYPDRIIDEEGDGDRSELLNEKSAWAICRVLRLAQQSADFIAGWANFDTANLAHGSEGFELYEVFPGGTHADGPKDVASFCLIAGTLEEPFPVLYLERAADTPPDPRDEYFDTYADQVRDQLED